MGTAVFHKGPPHHLRFGVVDIKGGAPHLRQSRQQENKQPQRLHQGIDGPLLLHDLHQVQGAGQHGDGKGHHHKGDLVTYQLRGRAQTPQDAILIGRTPPGHKQACNPQYGEGDNIQEAQIHVPDHQIPAEGDGNPHHKCGHKGDERGRPVNNLICPGGEDILFQKQLHSVGNGLKEAERPHPCRPQPLLETPQVFALQPHQSKGYQGKEGGQGKQPPDIGQGLPPQAHQGQDDNPSGPHQAG
ncbi:hypothetical protein HRbin23_00478 [bacterium HR23]|nr:hypothetical protein HRbin23_00478 [bacterium HR23]